MTTPTKSLWLVAHPLHQYAEDVKALARRHGLVIVDEAAAGDAERELAAEDPPALTLRKPAVKEGPQEAEKPAQAPEKRTARTAST